MKMKSTLTYLVLLYGVGLLGAKRYRCDYTYFKSIDTWFKFQEIPANWDEARLRCHLEGGNMASPTTPDLRQAMMQLLRQNGIDCPTYTGIHATFSRGDFYSIEGVPLRKINYTWAKGEPDNYNNKDSCIVILPDGTFADYNCDETLPYICYKKLKKTEIITECGTIDTDYTLDRRTGSCYKFHKEPKTWSHGQMACSAEGGYLTIINSETEAQVIREICIKNPPESILGYFRKDIIFVGFHDWRERGEWLTIHGQTLAEAGYAKFGPGEPNNGTTGEYCGSIYRSALFNDLWCEDSFNFICEKDLDSLLCDDDL